MRATELATGYADHSSELSISKLVTPSQTLVAGSGRPVFAKKFGPTRGYEHNATDTKA